MPEVPEPAPEPAGGEATAAARPAVHKEFPCSQCGAKVQFDPSSAMLKCPYCSAETAIPQSADDIQELDYRSHLARLSEAEEQLEAAAAKCSSCGAQMTLPEGKTAGDCPFCGSPVVSEAGRVSAIKPKSLLPFKITREDAWRRFRAWINGLWFAPSKLKEYARQEGRLNGVYVPYWTFDCGATSWYTGQRGDDYWETQHYTTTVNGKTVHRTRQVRRTRWTSVSGVVCNSFDDVLVLASKSIPRAYADKLAPWDLGSLVPYNPDYLSGFGSETYKIGLEEGFGIAAEVMEVTIRSTVCRDIGGDHQRISTLKTQHDNVTFKHLLLPVWISAYRFKERIFRILVNARTGEVQGERPWSWVKITLAVLGALAVVGTAAAIIAAVAGHG